MMAGWKNAKCRISGCANAVHVLKDQLCQKHYLRLRRHGNPEREPKHKRGTSGLAYCDLVHPSGVPCRNKKANRSNFCKKHTLMLKKFGRYVLDETYERVCRTIGCTRDRDEGSWFCASHKRRGHKPTPSRSSCCTVTVNGNRCKNRRVNDLHCYSHQRLLEKVGRANLPISDLRKYCVVSGCTRPREKRRSMCAQHRHAYYRKRGTSRKASLVGLPSWFKAWLSTQPCVICNWEVAARDIHHIEPFDPERPAESNRKENLLPLCPNHHREQQEGRLEKRFLQILNKEWLKTAPRTWPPCSTCGLRLHSWNSQVKHDVPCRKSEGKPSRRTARRRETTLVEGLDAPHTDKGVA